MAISIDQPLSLSPGLSSVPSMTTALFSFALSLVSKGRRFGFRRVVGVVLGVEHEVLPLT
jgi:hypothetical protein